MKEDLQKIHIAGLHLTGLISNILDLSKIEAGKNGLFLWKFLILFSFVNEVVDTVRPSIEKKMAIPFP